MTEEEKKAFIGPIIQKSLSAFDNMFVELIRALSDQLNDKQTTKITMMIGSFLGEAKLNIVAMYIERLTDDDWTLLQNWQNSDTRIKIDQLAEDSKEQTEKMAEAFSTELMAIVDKEE